MLLIPKLFCIEACREHCGLEGREGGVEIFRGYFIVREEAHTNNSQLFGRNESTFDCEKLLSVSYGVCFSGPQLFVSMNEKHSKFIIFLLLCEIVCAARELISNVQLPREVIRLIFIWCYKHCMLIQMMEEKQQIIAWIYTSSEFLLSHATKCFSLSILVHLSPLYFLQ